MCCLGGGLSEEDDDDVVLSYFEFLFAQTDFHFLRFFGRFFLSRVAKNENMDTMLFSAF